MLGLCDAIMVKLAAATFGPTHPEMFQALKIDDKHLEALNRRATNWLLAGCFQEAAMDIQKVKHQSRLLCYCHNLTDSGRPRTGSGVGWYCVMKTFYM